MAASGWMKRIERGLRQPWTGRKVVDSPWLNRAGLQVFRTAAAHGVYRLRPGPVRPELAGDLARLRRDGTLVLPDFLPDAEFRALAEECARYRDTYSPGVERLGCTTVEHFVVLQERLHGFPRIGAFFSHPTVVGLLEGAEKQRISGSTGYRVIERVTRDSDVNPDREAELHSDTFHPTHKLWLYLSDVTEGDGPLAYCPGTHRVARGEWKYIYRHSCAFGVSPSRRITAEEVVERGLREVKLTCAANTLVAADTHGYHRRTEGAPGRERHALQFMVRSSPFRVRTPGRA